MTTFTEGSKIQRELRISGVEKAVTVEITGTGLTFWVKGHRKRVSLSWYQALTSGQTPVDVPSFLMGKPIELLQYQAKEKAPK